MKTLKILLASLAVSAVTAVSANTIVLPALKDAVITISANLPSAVNTNYGNDQTFSTYHWTGWNTSAPVESRSLIDFDLSLIPLNAIITGATLNLYGTGGHWAPTNCSNASELRRITSAWQEFSVTWNTQPSTTNLNLVVLPQSTNASQNYAVNVLQLVLDMVSFPSTSHGFFLIDPVSTSWESLVFGSKDHANSDLHPTLTIEYECVETNLYLTADYDAAIGYHDGFNTQNNNYGTATQNGAYNIPGTAGGVNVNKALIHFDIFSNLPTNAVITNAEIFLFAYGPAANYPGHVESVSGGNTSILSRVTSPWSEMGVTWANQPTVNWSDFAYLPSTNNPMQNYVNMNVTNLVSAMLLNGPANDYGMMLELNAFNSGANMLIFCSEDHPNASLHPQLMISYHTGCESPQWRSSGGENVAIKKIKAQGLNTLQIRPNPSTGAFKLGYDGLLGKHVSLVIEDLQGKKVMEYILDNESNQWSIDLNAPAGVYLCKLVSDHSTLGVQKMIVTK